MKHFLVFFEFTKKKNLFWTFNITLYIQFISASV